MEKNIVTNRDTNIDLLKVLAMIMVITIHCLGNGLLLSNENLSKYNLLLIRILDSFALIANGLFFIITGYYQIDKKFNLKKIILLWGKTLFYSWFIYIICRLVNYNTPYMYESIMPILSGQYWFISTYIALYFISPILNIGLNSLNKKQFKYLLINLLIMVGIIRIVFNPSGIFSGALIPAILVYSIGAYVKKYVEVKSNEHYFTKYVLLTIIFVLIYILLKISINLINNKQVYYILKNIFNLFREYSSLLVIAMTYCMFMKFKSITIKSSKMNRLLTIISPSIFSVYLIHYNVNINYMWLYFNISKYYNSIFLLPYIIFLILVVFVVCLFIDIILRKLYSLIKRIRVIKRSINKNNLFIDKINKKINNSLY